MGPPIQYSETKIFYWQRHYAMYQIECYYGDSSKKGLAKTVYIQGIHKTVADIFSQLDQVPTKLVKNVHII